MRRAWPGAFALVLALLQASPAAAHGVGMSQLTLSVAGARIEGTWDLNLSDARLAVGLDPATGGAAGWRGLEARGDSLRTVLAGAFALSDTAGVCPIAWTDAPIEWIPDQEGVRLRFVSTCPAEPARLDLRCDLLFDLDPAHRAYFAVEDARVTHIGVFRAGLRAVSVDVHQFHAGSAILEFVREGVWHIWTGLDHMSFLVALLLPAVLVRAGGAWSPRPEPRRIAREVAKVVTAFTVAHSITLCLAFFGVVRLPAYWVELAIAASVFAAAWNNLRPFLPGRAWVLAFGFGLVHGLGFAGALASLSLPRHARGLALASFNVGVEVGQLAVVALVLPLIFLASRRAFYPRFVMGAASFVIAWMAVLWMLQRGFGLTLFAH